MFKKRTQTNIQTVLGHKKKILYNPYHNHIHDEKTVIWTSFIYLIQMHFKFPLSSFQVSCFEGTINEEVRRKETTCELNYVGKEDTASAPFHHLLLPLPGKVLLLPFALLLFLHLLCSVLDAFLYLGNESGSNLTAEGENTLHDHDNEAH